jgi:hypothetical protein
LIDGATDPKTDLMLRTAQPARASLRAERNVSIHIVEDRERKP